MRSVVRGEYTIRDLDQDSTEFFHISQLRLLIQIVQAIPILEGFLVEGYLQVGM